ALGTPRINRIVSAAGPLANIVCLLLLALPLQLGVDRHRALGVAIQAAALVQAASILLNLLPIPPLDGWQILSAGFSSKIRMRAASLGWMPIVFFYMLMNRNEAFGHFFWSIVFRCTELL